MNPTVSEPYPPGVSLGVSLDQRPRTTLELAFEAGIKDPAAIEQIVRLQLELADRQARIDYTAALAKFQEDCPPIPKTANFDVEGGGIKYAGWDEIGPIVKPVLARYGIVPSWSEIQIDYGTTENPHPNRMSGVCTLTVGSHTQRHEFNGMPLPKMTKAMSETQQWGAALSYFKRYSFINASGLIVTDEDNEAFLLDTLLASEVQQLQDLIREKKIPVERFLELAQVDSLDKILRSKFGRACDWIKAYTGGKK